MAALPPGPLIQVNPQPSARDGRRQRTLIQRKRDAPLPVYKEASMIREALMPCPAACLLALTKGSP